MDISVLMLVDVVLWSTGLSAAALAALLGLDWLESRRREGLRLSRSGAHSSLPQLNKLQPGMVRRRAPAAKPLAAKAA